MPTELELPHDVALGLVGDLSYDEYSIKLDKGDHVVLYTDGVNEAETRDATFFGMERFKNLFNETPSSAKQTTTKIFEAIDGFVGDFDQSDDITCLTLTIK